MDRFFDHFPVEKTLDFTTDECRPFTRFNVLELDYLIRDARNLQTYTFFDITHTDCCHEKPFSDLVVGEFYPKLRRISNPM
jgi:hypothetical protein